MNIQFFFVDIIEYETENIIKRLGPFNSERTAEKCCDGVDRNLNYERFYTRIEKGDTGKIFKKNQNKVLT